MTVGKSLKEDVACNTLLCAHIARNRWSNDSEQDGMVWKGADGVFLQLVRGNEDLRLDE